MYNVIYYFNKGIHMNPITPTSQPMDESKMEDSKQGESEQTAQKIQSVVLYGIDDSTKKILSYLEQYPEDALKDLSNHDPSAINQVLPLLKPDHMRYLSEAQMKVLIPVWCTKEQMDGLFYPKPYPGFIFKESIESSVAQKNRYRFKSEDGSKEMTVSAEKTEKIVLGIRKKLLVFSKMQIAQFTLDEDRINILNNLQKAK